jgi:hypothetical protein
LEERATILRRQSIGAKDLHSWRAGIAAPLAVKNSIASCPLSLRLEDILLVQVKTMRGSVSSRNCICAGRAKQDTTIYDNKYLKWTGNEATTKHVLIYRKKG